MVWALLAVVWLVCGATVVAAAVRSRRDPQALRAGRLAVGVLYLVAGALVHVGLLASGEDYRGFADGAAVGFVRRTWESLVVPHHLLFIGALVVFEAAVGVLVLLGGRAGVAGLAAAAAFHVALVAFGWGFLVWSLPVGGALVVLARGELAVVRGRTPGRRGGEGSRAAVTAPGELIGEERR